MILTRAAFFTAIGAALARAQQACVGPLWSSTCPKVNGQCPMCGWMAPKYEVTIEQMRYSFGQCAPPPTDGSTTLSVCRNWSEADLPTERRIDCERCNTTFRQYREGVKR